MSFFDSYFFSKIWQNVWFRPPFQAFCSISSQRAVLSIPIRNSTENPPGAEPGSDTWARHSLGHWPVMQLHLFWIHICCCQLHCSRQHKGASQISLGHQGHSKPKTMNVVFFSCWHKACYFPDFSTLEISKSARRQLQIELHAYACSSTVPHVVLLPVGSTSQSSRKNFLATSPVGLVTDQAH